MTASTVTRRPRRRKNRPEAPTDVYTGYRRVSTREQAESRAGLDVQQTVLQGWAAINNVTIAYWRQDEGASAKDLRRKELGDALEDVRERRSCGIVVAKLDRLTRSVTDFSELLAEAQRDGWNLVALDLGIDLRTPTGQLIAKIVAVIAEWERLIIGERTRDGLEAKRAEGVRLGRPRTMDDDVLERVITTYFEHQNYAEAARVLNRAEVPTACGGRRWYPASVRNTVLSQDGLAAAAAMGVAS